MNASQNIELERLMERNQALTADVNRLNAELARMRAELKKTRILAWVLAAPWLLVTAPLALPAAWLATRVRRWFGLSLPSLRGRRRRTLVYDAFLAHRADGPQKALDMLAAAGSACPPGAADLFRAMSARSDEEWLAATNAWAVAAALPEIRLAAGSEPRFFRMVMPAVEPVLARDTVTVIMPAFNARRTIGQAMRSILDQSWRNLELIVVDDASSDGTAEVAEQIAASDPRVRVLRNPVNVGPYVSKNRALLLATGRYVTGHDADDIALPTRITDQMRPILDDTTCAATLAYMVRLDSHGAFSYPAGIGSSSYDGIARRAMISLLIDRELLMSRLGFWDSVRFGADGELIARATALLGPRLREVRKVVMLCLNAEGSLTNHAEHGISVWRGNSPIRQAYRDSWTAWHAASPASERRLPFPHGERLFAAPLPMVVPDDDVRQVVQYEHTPRIRVCVA